MSKRRVQAMRFDLVIDNANIYTVDPAQPGGGSMGIIGDRIVAVGRRGEFERFDASRTIDLDGRFVTAGFNDAHNHMQAYGATLTEVPLHGDIVHSIGELVAAMPSGSRLPSRGPGSSAPGTTTTGWPSDAIRRVVNWTA